MNNVTRKLISAGGFMGVVAVVVMFLFMATGTLSRYLLNRPMRYPLDVSELMLLWLFFFPLASTLMAKGHTNIDLVTQRLPSGLRRGLALISSFAGLCWSAVITGMGSVAVWESFAYKSVTFIGQLPLYPFLFAIPCGGALFFAAFALQAIQDVRGE